MAIRLHILSPEGTLVRQEVDRVELPGASGRFVVLKDHAPLVSYLVEGEIVYGDGMPGTDRSSHDGRVKISSGFVEVIDNQVTACIEAR